MLISFVKGDRNMLDILEPILTTSGLSNLFEVKKKRTTLLNLLLG